MSWQVSGLAEPGKTPAQPDTSGQRGVVVTGMHRSGTSALTRVINLLGIPLADRSDLWLELPGNNAGYWESASLAQLNERLLGRLKATWWCPPPPGQESRLSREAGLVAEARRMFCDLHPTRRWVWKDPRTSLTLPFWRAVLSDSFVGVLALRRPLEVAASLAQRDGLPLAWSLALWERYTRSALTGLRGLPVLIVPYDSLLDEASRWCATAIAFLAEMGVLEEPDEAGCDEVGHFLDLHHRHWTRSDADLLLSPLVTTAQTDLYFTLRNSAERFGGFEPPELPSESPSTEELFNEIRANGARDLPEQLRHRVAARHEPRHGRARPERVLMSEHDEKAEAHCGITVLTSNLLSDDWRRWVAENLMLRVPDHDIVRVLADVGVDAGDAYKLLGELRSDPLYQAGDWMAQRLAKLHSLLDIHAELAGLRSGRGSVERRWRPNSEEFLRDFYARNEPVVLTGLTDGWKAMSDWSPRYLRDRFSDQLVEVMAERETDDMFELNSQDHKLVMRFGEYIDLVERADHTNDVYMVANNHLLDRPEMEPLLDDFTTPADYLDPAQRNGQVFLWFGPRGTLTPLHHDVANVLFVQILGRKRFRLIPSLQTHRVYNDIGVYSQVDPDAADLTVHPRFAGVQPIEFVVEPGEALFIPVGYWHQVESLEVSISLSFTNFAFPNDYYWEHPQIIR